ncbi:hypothetical protein [Jeotgalibacillus soli]|jgi:hypothetical protein|nr:hypothetical protein [Jeotgalibacillus soli]
MTKTIRLELAFHTAMKEPKRDVVIQILYRTQGDAMSVFKAGLLVYKEEDPALNLNDHFVTESEFDEIQIGMSAAAMKASIKAGWHNGEQV